MSPLAPSRPSCPLAPGGPGMPGDPLNPGEPVSPFTPDRPSRPAGPGSPLMPGRPGLPDRCHKYVIVAHMTCILLIYIRMKTQRWLRLRTCRSRLANTWWTSSTVSSRHARFTLGTATNTGSRFTLLTFCARLTLTTLRACSTCLTWSSVASRYAWCSFWTCFEQYVALARVLAKLQPR